MIDDFNLSDYITVKIDFIKMSETSRQHLEIIGREMWLDKTLDYGLAIEYVLMSHDTS